MRNNRTGLIVTILGLMILSACSMKQDIHIRSAGDGTVSVDLTLADYLTDVIIQVQTLLQPENPVDPDAPFFNTDSIRSDFEKREGVELLQLDSTDPDSLTGEFRFDDVERLFQNMDDGSPESRLIRYSSDGEVSGMEIHITRDTVEALLEANPSLRNPLVDNFGPTTTEGLSESDYLDMMEFALGSESRQGLLDSRLELTIHVENRILDQQGGELLDSRTVRYRIPVLPFLMLDEPLVYSLRYQ